MNKGFIFTLDAVLALIPIFIILASVSQTGDLNFYQQRHQVELTKLAHDSMTVLPEIDVFRTNNVLEDIIINNNIQDANESLNMIIPNTTNYMLILQNGTREEYIVGRAGGVFTESVVNASLANASDIAVATKLVYISKEEALFINGTYEECKSKSISCMGSGPPSSGNMTVCRYPLLVITNQTFEAQITIYIADTGGRTVDITAFDDTYNSTGFVSQTNSIAPPSISIPEDTTGYGNYWVTAPTTPGTYGVDASISYRCGAASGTKYPSWDIGVRRGEGVVGTFIFKLYVWDI